jgi:hypothetical protein
MSAAAKSSSYLAAAMASDGFVIECIRGPKGERFGIISREPSIFAGLHKIPPDSFIARTSSPVKDCWFSGPLSEADVRAKLTDAGLSTTNTDAKLVWARQWVTTITRKPGSDL